MNDSEILIIGANGQLGTALKEKYPDAQAVDAAELDITDEQALVNFNWQKIKIILNAAAYTNVDGAETPEGRVAAWMINADAVANLVAVAAQHDITLLHISTDYVFDGTQVSHDESEPFSPLSVYGASKAAGDLIVSLAPRFYIMRTSWVIGEGKNFVRTMLELGKKGIAPTVVADQIGRLTFTSELVRAIDHIISNSCNFGTYNVSNSGEPTSWANITRAIFKDAELDLQVTDTTTADYYAGKADIAPRPPNSQLDLAKIESVGFKPRGWQEDLVKYVKKELSKS